ncbi:hypothetical protein KUTeg_008873 [Tegillarca granosa]|uniref:Ribosome biogenesis protein WDR12 homolog n=1 Tax=Tegillarca granosa TaxID=220873 RepID=A0ABQ9FCX3_TEGGR|nr:hypothetical protein KUTeg_008873 [Tegillarca granosa]
MTIYAVPDAPFSVQAVVGTKELSSLINSLLKENTSDHAAVDFDFMVNGEFLRVTLNKHLEQKGISHETIVEIEYIECHPAPKPEDSLLHDDWVSSVQGCQDCILCGCYDNTLRLWSTSGQPLMTIPGHSAPLKCVRWISVDGSDCRFISGSHDQTIFLWQWNRDRNEVDCIHACRGHAGSVDCLAVDSTKQRVPILTLSGHNEGVSAASWIGDNEICTSSWDHTIRLWDITQATQKSLLQGTKAFFDVSYSHLNKMIITASCDRHIRLWDPRASDGAIVKCTYSSHTGWVSSVRWSETNEYLFLSGSHDTVMKLWDTRSPKAPLYNMSGHEDKILAVDWSVPHLLLSGAADNHLKIFRYQDSHSS